MNKRKTGKMVMILIAVILSLAALAFGGFRWLEKAHPVRAAIIREAVFGHRENYRDALTEVKASDLTIRKSIEELTADERTALDESMRLINREHLLPDDYEAEVLEYETSGVYMNPLLHDAYRSLKEEVAERFGEKLYIRSAYRTAAEQQQAIEEEGEKATAVGASEHQAGLALDVYVPGFSGLGFVNCDAGRFVDENCGDYGFIVRYPLGAQKVTGIAYEPWHLRYVGFPHARIIMDAKGTLEGYLEALKYGKIYRYEAYVIEHVREGDTVSVPDDYEACGISLDGCGGYVVVFRE